MLGNVFHYHISYYKHCQNSLQLTVMWDMTGCEAITTEVSAIRADIHPVKIHICLDPSGLGIAKKHLHL